MKNYYIFQNNKKKVHCFALGGTCLASGVATADPTSQQAWVTPWGLRPHVGGRRGTEAKDAPELTGTRHCPGGPGVPWTAP